ncbi:ComEC/Rec2 family competence protein [Paenibacillus sp. NFR01]|uniref:ComEC/Rec2 family competence protein n=1 Tax=Paenibacillus sp. NFR01 TaxID=1566279 RepID=UPI0008B14907|nr:ComEC/Rec2 family competence protein [Paenibacillus sp. NFR01]SET67428.1 competence protein ComEC [Paenibacillus sp. NFR01]
MKGRPLLMFTACWVAGTAAGRLSSGEMLVYGLAGGVLLIVLLAWQQDTGWKPAALFMLALVAAALYWEWTDSRNASNLPESLGAAEAELNERQVTAEGVIVSAVERDGDKVEFTVKLSALRDAGGGEAAGTPEPASDKAAGSASAEVSGAGAGAVPDAAAAGGERVLAQIKLGAESEIAAAAAWRRGDRIRLAGELRQPAEARDFGAFDYRDYLHTRRIHWLLKGSGAASVQVTPPAAWNSTLILRWNDAARAALGAEMDRLFSGVHSGYMKGLVIGIQDDLDPATFREFSQLGLTHILAISGMHVAVYVGALLYILRRCRLTEEAALTVAFLLVPAYVLMSGAGPSVVRAGIMSMIALAAARFGILKDGLNILAASALFMLIWNPYLLMSVSFQLSFLVTAGLMVYVPLAAPLLRSLPRWLSGAMSVTLVAQFVSFPLTVYYFNQFSLFSFAANLVLVPFITFLVLPLGTLALLLGRLWEGAARKTAWLAERLNDGTFRFVEWLNGWSGGVLIWRSPSLLWICTYYLLLYGLLYTINQRREADEVPLFQEDETKPLTPAAQAAMGGKKQSPAMPGFVSGGALGNRGGLLLTLGFAALIGLLYWGYRTDQPAGIGRISYIDVGQGDSILITTPGGAHVLVDGGGTLSFGSREAWRERRDPYEVGAKLLVPLLKQRGIHRLDAVIMTHGDQDHAGGLQAVLESIPVSALLFNGTLADTAPYAKLMRTALDRGVRLYSVHAGLALTPDADTKLSFLWPDTAPSVTAADAAPPIETVGDQNHQSVAFTLEMNGHRFLFTGDMDEAAEDAVLEAAVISNESGDSSIDVLKVAHHGSKSATGAEWLKYWKPKAAVISAGVNNLYGHPHVEVVDRLEAGGTVIFRTDQDGEIQMDVGKEGIRIRCKLGGEVGTANEVRNADGKDE